jgi:exonuclease III
MLRNWNILDWNVRGINSQRRWDDIRLRTKESNCGIICFQETKRETFDQAYLRNFCHRRFNNYAYIPSIGNTGALLPYGMAIYFMALLLVKAPTRSLLILHAIYLALHGL